MKINLTINNLVVMGDWVNVDPLCGDGTKKNVPLDNLDEICDNGEVEVIRANMVLSFYSYRVTQSIINHWAKKLEIGGKLILIEKDADQIINAFKNRKIQVGDLNTLMLGEQNYPFQYCRSLTNLKQMTRYIENAGLKVTMTDFGNIYFTIEAIRQ
jgi:hypothetical protein